MGAASPMRRTTTTCWMLGVPVRVAPDPLTAVVRGTAIVLNDLDAYRDALLKSDDELVPTE